MSLLKSLQERKKVLKVTNTVVKTPGGEVFLEKRDDLGKLSMEKLGSAEGFVVDFKPDLQVAKILPGLCIGSQDVTQDLKLLQEHKITHILSVGIQVKELPWFKYTFIEALDLPDYDMKSVFARSKEIIDMVRNLGEVIFVHCNAGVSRSVAVVIAYLIKSEHFKYQEALDLIKEKRPCAKPNEGFTRQLKLLEEV